MTPIARTDCPFLITPWGAVFDAWNAADGITFVATASHGGFHVADALLAQMPPALRALSLTADNWFEEDAAWIAVAIAFPHAFSAAEQAHAARLYAGHAARAAPPAAPP